MFVYQSNHMARLLQRYGNEMCLLEKTRENITAALTKIKEWNPDFDPLCAMVDCCAEEINALETLYPGKR